MNAKRVGATVFSLAAITLATVSPDAAAVPIFWTDWTGTNTAAVGFEGHGTITTNSTTIGGRASYAMTKHAKFLAEAAYSQIKPDGSPTQKLAKLTVGPALSTGPGFWNRPELRLYVTSAKWNQAANDGYRTFDPVSGALLTNPGLTGFGDNKRTGTSYGAQVEIWF
jgi:maltoporin